MDSFLSGEQCVGEPARVSPALPEGLPPQVAGIGYSNLYSYKEATALASRESDMVRVAHLKLGVRASAVCPAPTSREGQLPTIRTSENRPL
ncbi:MAG: hypothetical protein V7K90_02925 [Nostoc sp.]|uniref:hypothetical protein n=1 Tax=Nostoc sp. TaxID=1180 RepID=UPI002FF4CA06